MERVSRLTRGVLCGLGGVGLAILILRITIVNTVAGTGNIAGPKAVDQLFIGNLAVQYAKAHRIPSSAYPIARRIARQQPLASGPFAVIALDAIARGQTAKATALLEAGRSRNPRDRFIRVLLLEQYATAENYPKAAQELANIYRLVPDVGEALIGVMTKMATDPAGLAPLARAVRGDPALGPLLANLVKTGAPISSIITLARGMPASDDPEKTVWQPMLLQRLVAEGHYAQARALWASFAKVPADDHGRLIFNVAFAPARALPPFNWETAQENIGTIDLMGRGTASVAYFGRESGPLLRQLLTLSPGHYRFQYAVEGDRDLEPGTMVWRVRCAVTGSTPAAGPSLAEVPLQTEMSGKRAVAIAFTVPAGCSAQWLSLDGVSAEFPTSRTLELSGLALTRRK